MVPPVVASLPHLRPDSSRKRIDFTPVRSDQDAEGRRPKNFHRPASAAAPASASTLPNLTTKTPISANRPSFFAATPPTSAAMPYSAMWSVLALKSS